MKPAKYAMHLRDETLGRPRTVSLIRLKPLRNGAYSEGDTNRGSCANSLLSVVYGIHATEALEARRLVELRDRWLNPPEWVEWLDEPVPGYPKRPVPRDEAAATALKKRTLTNLYNTRP